MSVLSLVLCAYIITKIHMAIGGTRLYDLSGSTRTYYVHMVHIHAYVHFRTLSLSAGWTVPVSQSHESRLECLTLSSDVSVNVDLGKLQQ